MFGGTYIHCTIDQHVKAQTATGAKLERADTALGTIVKHHTAHATDRGQIAGKLRQGRPIQLASMNSHAGQYGSQVSGCCWT